VDEATEEIVALDDAGQRCGRCGDRTALIQALMRPTMVVIGDIFGEHAPEVALAQDEQMIEHYPRVPI